MRADHLILLFEQSIYLTCRSRIFTVLDQR